MKVKVFQEDRAQLNLISALVKIAYISYFNLIWIYCTWEYLFIFDFKKMFYLKK